MEPQPMTQQGRKRLYDKKYREANRELLLLLKAEYRKKMCQCSCGQTVSRSSLSHHLKTKKHLRLLQEQEEVAKPNDVADTEEEAIQQETVEEPLLEITEEEVSLLQRLQTLFRR